MTNKENLITLIQARAQFRKHLFFYLVANTLFWLLFMLTKSGYYTHNGITLILIWPIWPTLLWGAGVAYHWSKINSLNVVSKKLPLDK